MPSPGKGIYRGDDEEQALERRGTVHGTLNELSDKGHSIADAVKLGLVKPTEVAALEQIKAKRAGGAIGGGSLARPSPCAPHSPLPSSAHRSPR